MNGHKLFRALSIAAAGMTYITMLFGGNVIASGSGLACPDWPTCDGSIFGPLSGAAGIEWSHRLAALVLGLVVLALALTGVFAENRRPVLRTLSLVSLGLVVILALIGGLVIESRLAIVDVLVHFGLATILFGITLLLALLSNLREIPRRWIDRAWQAGEERSLRPGPEKAPAPGVGRSASSGVSALALDLDR